MQEKLSFYVKQLQKIIFIYDGKTIQDKIKILKAIAAVKWRTAEDLQAYVELLLFIISHPENKEIVALVVAEFERITAFFSTAKNQADNHYVDLGFPFTNMCTQFSHDILHWMNQQPFCKLSVDSFDETGVELNLLLRTTLLAVEREETTAGLANKELLKALKIKPENEFTFLLNEFSKLNAAPYAKDFLWDALKVWVTIKSTDKKYSRIYNQIPINKIYYQSELIKKFDSEKLINTLLPTAKKLSTAKQKQLASVIKNSLTLTMRETDPSTAMNEKSLLFYELERGVSIALYGMEADRQLPLQSYIGYTLFKNGYPTAYGGSWIFGTAARFGLNIFEAFRGGESGYTMCQLLRVYKQVFGLETIEVDAYMFGKNNPDGISSGAFWFYYRYGFRLIDKKLQALAEKELQKIKATAGYRTSPKTLLQFTDSNIELSFGKAQAISRTAVLEKIAKMIASEFNGDRLLAEKKCITIFLQKSKTTFSPEQQFALSECALLAKAMQWHSTEKTKLLTTLIQTKYSDAVQYNAVLKQLLK